MLVTVAAMLAAMLVLASPASAQSENAGCKDFGNAIAGFS